MQISFLFLNKKNKKMIQFNFLARWNKLMIAPLVYPISFHKIFGVCFFARKSETNQNIHESEHKNAIIKFFFVKLVFAISRSWKKLLTNFLVNFFSFR